MSIRGLKQDTIARFNGKRITVNLAQNAPGDLLSAKNLLILQDGQLRRAPGYAWVMKVGNGPIKGEPYDFQRNVDQKQFVFIQSGDEIWACSADGRTKQLMSSGEIGTHQFVCNSFAAYSSDGTNAWRYVDKAGTLTKYKWGIAAPTAAPGITTSAGTLTLTYGRAYVFCYVSKYTDSLGIQRVSVSAPSSISAHSGPVASQVVTLSSITASADAQVNYIWVFATSDSPFDTSATFYFAAEITNGTTSWGDTLPDSALDQTRLAEFDANPAPPSPILTTFQNRVVAGNGNQIRLSAFSETNLGIPEENWPLDLFFDVPSGKRTISGVTSMQEGTVLQVSTQDFWYRYTGYDATTFQEQDKVASPGTAGPLALVETPEGLMYLTATQSLRVWNGSSSDPTSISDDISKPLYNTYSMSDIDMEHIADSILCWYDYGPMNLLVAFLRTLDYQGQGFNWMQIWSFATEARDTSGIYGAGSGVYTQLTGTYQTDKLPTDGITGAGSVEVGFQGQRYIFMGDANGDVYRWPDGFTDNGNPVMSVGQLAWALPNNGQSRNYWIDLITDRTDAKDAFKVYAATADAPDMQATPVQLSLQNVPNPKKPSQYTIRASMNADGVATGKYVTAWIQFPNDDQDAAVRTVEFNSRPLNKGIA